MLYFLACHYDIPFVFHKRRKAFAIFKANCSASPAHMQHLLMLFYSQSQSCSYFCWCGSRLIIRNYVCCPIVKINNERKGFQSAEQLLITVWPVGEGREELLALLVAIPFQPFCRGLLMGKPCLLEWGND